jgi:hypothetical protein
MAKQKNNVVTYGLSGKIGDLLIFRRINGKTVISKTPERSKTVTEKQTATRKRFRQVTFYAKAAVANPENPQSMFCTIGADGHIEIGAYRMGYRIPYRIPYRISCKENENYEFDHNERFKAV